MIYLLTGIADLELVALRKHTSSQTGLKLVIAWEVCLYGLLPRGLVLLLIKKQEPRGEWSPLSAQALSTVGLAFQFVQIRTRFKIELVLL